MENNNGAQHPSIVSMQQSMKDAAADREKQAADKPPDDANDPLKKPGEKKPAGTPASEDLSTQLKNRYNLDLSEEEILTRLGAKPTNGHTNGQTDPTTPAPVVKEKAKTITKEEDISDEQLGDFFTKNDRPELLTEYKSLSEKKDLALVMEHELSLVQKQFPDLKRTEAENLIKERFFMSDEDDTYSPSEKALGQYLLKQSADRLRGGVTSQVDMARKILVNSALEEQAQSQYEESVDAFVKTLPKQMTMQLGKSGAIPLGAFDMDLEDTTLTEITEIMRRPEKLLERFRPEGKQEGLDLRKLYDFLLKGSLFENAIKSAAVDYYSRGADAVGNRFNNFPDLKTPNSSTTKKTASQQQQEEKAIEYNKKQLADNTGSRRR